MELIYNQLFKSTPLAIRLLLALIIFSGCGNDDHEDGICTPGIGLSRPSQTCSINDICTDLVPSYAIYNPSLTYLDTESDEPFCGTSELGITLGRPYHYDGLARHWLDDDGVDRYWCESRPAGSSNNSPRPLVVWMTGSGGGAGNVYDKTSLRSKQQTFNLAGDPDRPGFILVSIQPRNLQWPSANSLDGTRSEIFYRDFESPSANSDIAFIDHVIDTLAGEGVVDLQRIYMMGWSNGARFSALYAIARHDRPTPGGNRIAAVSNYSGGDPYASFDYTLPQCALSNLPRSSVPYFMISRQCDLIACYARTDTNTMPGNVAEPWMNRLRNEIGADVTWLIIDSLGNPGASCASEVQCSAELALSGHLRWPDGVEVMGGTDHEPGMLQFLADHGF
jgi:hypothetical protein